MSPPVSVRGREREEVVRVLCLLRLACQGRASWRCSPAHCKARHREVEKKQSQCGRGRDFTQLEVAVCAHGLAIRNGLITDADERPRTHIWQGLLCGFRSAPLYFSANSNGLRNRGQLLLEQSRAHGNSFAS